MAQQISNVKLEHLLKVDTFTQKFKVIDKHNRTIPRKLIHDTDDFFKYIYVRKKHEIKVNGIVYKNDGIESWIKRNIKEAENSLLLVIQGYAGCGKTTWVQSIFHDIFDGEYYDYSYYNYYIGTYPTKNSSTNNPIFDSIVDGLIKQITMIMTAKDGKTVFETFKKLSNHPATQYLDQHTVIWSCFACTESINSSVDRILSVVSEDEKKEAINDLKESVKNQIENEKFNIYRLLCMDYLWRLAQYISDPIKYRNNLFVCYDNLDSIYDNQLLKEFRSVLLYFRHNITEYVYALSEDETIFDGLIPPFVIITTYRKITEVRSSTDNVEMANDVYNSPDYVKQVEVSNLYNYKEILEKRAIYFSNKLNTDSICGANTEVLKEQLSKVLDLLNVEFIEKYADLLNHNYRSCGNILSIVFNTYDKSFEKCIELLKSKSAVDLVGANAIVLHAVCSILENKGIWNSNNLDFANHKDEESGKDTSLSRLILNFLSNNKTENVSIADIFEIFDKVFEPEYICKILTQMLKRHPQEIWRRPICYAKNAFVNEYDVERDLLNQYEKYKKGDKQNLIEFSICECGKTLISDIVPRFEFYSSRLVPNSQSLYCIEKYDDLEFTLSKVFRQIEICCKKQNTFRKRYINKYNIVNSFYLRRQFHPKTKLGNYQLHVERVIFSHIADLNEYRRYLYYSSSASNELRNKLKDVDKLIIGYIDDYLELYHAHIARISYTRRIVADQIKETILEAKIKCEEGKFYSIEG